MTQALAESLSLEPEEKGFISNNHGIERWNGVRDKHE
jgi:hypothetical protein